MRPELKDNRDVEELPPWASGDSNNSVGTNGPGGNDSGGIPGGHDLGNSETPRERLPAENPLPPASGGAGNYNSALPQSSTPRPAQSSATMTGGKPMIGESQPVGLQPFSPMMSTPAGSPAGAYGPIGHPGGGSSQLFGSLGGLKGGGLGTPMSTYNPNSNNMSISQLIAMLQQKRQGRLF